MTNKVGQIYKDTISMIFHTPMILFSFILLGIVDAATLTSLFLSHTEPFSIILAPIIRRFWGDRFLHYPENFFLLPKLFGYAHLLMLTVFGLIVTGLVIKLIQSQLEAGAQGSTVQAAGAAFKKYFSLLGVWIPVFLIMRFGSRLILPRLPETLVAQFAAILVFFLVVQSLTAFLFPAVMISDRGFLKAVGEGFRLVFRNLGLVAGTLFLPALTAVVMLFLKSMSPRLVPVFPEMVLVILYVGILISVVVDLFVTSATTILYLRARNSES